MEFSVAPAYLYKSKNQCTVARAVVVADVPALVAAVVRAVVAAIARAGVVAIVLVFVVAVA